MRCCQVDWLLMSDIGEVIKKIVDSQAFPDYQIPKKSGWAKKAPCEEVRMWRYSQRDRNAQARGQFQRVADSTIDRRATP
jgi:hypothetical protein